MSMKKEDYEEFQRQLELQNTGPLISTVKTKKDEDGTEYEWDESKKAWFPKLSTDLIIQYQSGYSNTDDNKNTSESTYHDPLTKTTYIWDSEKNSWTPKTMQYNYPDNYKYTDPKSGCTYAWNAQKQTWSVVESNKSENSESSSNVSTTDKPESQNAPSISPNSDQGVYIHPESGIKYKWDQAKQLWITDSGEVLYPSNWNYTDSQNYTDKETGKSYKWDIMDQQWKEVSNEKKKKSKSKAPGSKRSANKPEWFQVQDEKNSSVYVSGLPLDITKQEFSDIMSKCGIIATNPISNENKIKLYLDEEGNPKGDGLCCYLKRESVVLALQIVDEMNLRNSTLKVQEAEFQMKGHYDPSKKPKMLSKKEKKKLQKEKEKLLDWKLNRAEDTVSKTDRVVIFKKMFDVSEFEEDPVLITEIRDDLRRECEKFGAVKKVIVFDRHPDGVCSVAFKEVDAAAKCQKALNGRWFACKSIEAMVWDGVTDYQIEETDKEREVRLQKWEQFLSGGDDGESNAKATEEKSETTDTKD